MMLSVTEIEAENRCVVVEVKFQSEARIEPRSSVSVVKLTTPFPPPRPSCMSLAIH